MVAMNATLAAINSVKIFQLLRQQHDDAVFDVIEVRPESQYLQHILNNHRDDIARFQPDLDWQPGRAGSHAFVVVKGDETVGVVLLRRRGRRRARPARLRDAEVPRLLPRRVRVAAQRAAAGPRLHDRCCTPPDMVGRLLRQARLGLRNGRGPLRAGALRPQRRGRGDPAVEGGARGAGVDRLGRLRDAGGQRLLERGCPGASWTASAAPALRSTASRTGPVSPSSRRRTTSALCVDVAAAQRARRATGRCRAPAGRPSPSVTWPSWTTHTDDVAVVVSSSRPSSPRNTHASTPRRAKTPAITGAIRGSAQPIAWASGLAGLASGPRKLKVVPMPSSRRGHGGVPQRRVERGREAERDAGLDRRPRPPGRRAGRAGCRAPRARRRSRTSTTRSGCRA